MPNFIQAPPLSLYIHIPWCVRKCPYCDFNSHELKAELPEELYISALLQDLSNQLSLITDRQVISIFFGGGTPSLFSANGIKKILNGVGQQLPLSPAIEITLEANPGTIDHAHFHAYREAGINRLSLGIQSLQNAKLKKLGRIHDRENALRAIDIAKQAGFSNFNLDMMYGLPQQSLAEALNDVNDALAFHPTHFSWYQLTIEPNTFFYQQRPILPDDDLIWEMQVAGQTILKQNGLKQYEVSAYATSQNECLHNKNYWEFGDYLGMGAGAHSKITDIANSQILRFSQVKHPRDYLDATKRSAKNFKIISEKDLCFEFMLNALRLIDGVPIALFQQRTGLSLEKIATLLSQAKQKKLLMESETRICATAQGQRFLNDLVGMFLSDDKKS